MTKWQNLELNEGVLLRPLLFISWIVLCQLFWPIFNKNLKRFFRVFHDDSSLNDCACSVPPIKEASGVFNWEDISINTTNTTWIHFTVFLNLLYIWDISFQKIELLDSSAGNIYLLIRRLWIRDYHLIFILELPWDSTASRKSLNYLFNTISSLYITSITLNPIF